jgi:hypothetical protein
VGVANIHPVKINDVSHVYCATARTEVGVENAVVEESSDRTRNKGVAYGNISFVRIAKNC